MPLLRQVLGRLNLRLGLNIVDQDVLQRVQPAIARITIRRIKAGARSRKRYRCAWSFLAKLFLIVRLRTDMLSWYSIRDGDYFTTVILLVK